MFSSKDIFLTKAKGGYTIAKSLRFRSSASAYLSRTFGTPTDNKKWTFSCWVKGSFYNGTSYTHLFGTGAGSTDTTSNQLIWVTSGSNLCFSLWSINILNTNAVYRDPSAWYHIMLVMDNANATASNRAKIYVNGVEPTYSTDNRASLSTTTNYAINSAIQHTFARWAWSAFAQPEQYDGYLAETYFIDGQALTPSSFGQTDTATGVWMPKAYTGTYGTNGFYLNFSDASAATAAAIGKDSSGNGNNWTPTNISVTAGVTYDSMVDTPTNYDNGGNGAGNYAVLNPLIPSTNTFSQGNLVVTAGAAANAKFVSTIGVTSGKWYMEFAVSPWPNAAIGITSTTVPQGYLGMADGNTSVSFWPNTTNTALYVNGVSQTFSGSATTWASTDIAGLALDADSGTIALYKNGTLVGSAYSYTSLWTGLTYFAGGNYLSGQIYYANFGQRAFNSTPPSGFKALCTQNLPTPTIGATSSTLANKYFDISLWNGNATSPRSITGLGFQPDFAWIKNRSDAINHVLYDAVRGAGSGKALSSNSTLQEGLGASSDTANGYLSAFNSDGISITAGSSTSLYVNTSPNAYVAWQWKANGSGTLNQQGSVTSTVSANVTAGFSVLTWTGTGATSATVGHGLSVLPNMVIIKKRNVVENWYVAHTGSGQGINFAYHLFLNTTGALSGSNDPYLMGSQISTTSNVLALADGTGNNGGNQSGTTYVAYCFSEVKGYSKFGSYTGNASADGPFVYCGFRPRFVMIKATGAAEVWNFFDTSRDTYNPELRLLFPNTADAEFNSGSTWADITANGFKIRYNGSPFNTSGGNYIFAAFAETPFNYSRGR